MDVKLLAACLCALLLSVAALSAADKCPYDEYEIAGLIRQGSGHPVDGAQVFAFFDDVTATDTEATTAADGRYRVHLKFDTFRRSSAAGDKCDKKPDLLEVVVWQSGFRPVRQRFKRKDLTIRETGSITKLIQLEPISLERR